MFIILLIAERPLYHSFLMSLMYFWSLLHLTFGKIIFLSMLIFSLMNDYMMILRKIYFLKNFIRLPNSRQNQRLIGLRLQMHLILIHPLYLELRVVINLIDLFDCYQLPLIFSSLKL